MTDERESPSGDDNWDDLADFLGAEGAKDQFAGNDEDDDPEVTENDELDSESTGDDAVEEGIVEEESVVSEDADWAEDDDAEDAENTEEQDDEAGNWVVLAEQLGIETGELEDELESVADEAPESVEPVDELLEEDTDETDADGLQEEEPGDVQEDEPGDVQEDEPGDVQEDEPGDIEDSDDDDEDERLVAGESLDQEPESAIDEAVAEIARLFGSEEEGESKTDEGDDSGDADPESEDHSAKPRGRRRRSRRGRRPDVAKTENGDPEKGEPPDKSSEEAGPDDKKRRRGRRGGRRRGDKATNDRAADEQGEESGGTDEPVARKATRNITTWKDVVGVIVDGNIAADRKDQKPRRKRRSK